MIKRFITIMLLALLLGAGALGVHAADLYVTTTDDQVPGSLRAAITTANSNGEDDVIHLPAGLYILKGDAGDDANASGDLDIDTGHSLAIKGEGIKTTIIDGNMVDRILHIIKGTVSISGVAFKNGRSRDGYNGKIHAENGGGILNRGVLTLTQCKLTNNLGGNGYFYYYIYPYYWVGGSGGSGGAIYNEGVLTLNKVLISNNAGGLHGPQYCHEVPLEGHPGSGGAIFNSESGTMNLKDCIISNNRSGYSDGGYLDEDVFINGGDGGGICNHGTQVLNNCRLISNHTGHGGYGNIAIEEEGRSGRGGAIFNSGNSTVKKCTILDNYTEKNPEESHIVGTATGGGGIFNTGTFSLSDCDISHNTLDTAGTGGGIHNKSGKLTLIRCSITDNKSGDGCLQNFDSHELAHGGKGGGIFNEGDMVITNCTISGNNTGEGVAIVWEGYGNGGDGAGIYNRGALDVIDSTICNNVTGAGHADGAAGFGGGIYNQDGYSLNIRNTIVADNKTKTSGEGQDAWGVLKSQGYNLIKDTGKCVITGDTTGNFTGVDPLLGPLANNGGPTQTHALLPGSPAIDAGNSPGNSQDQRGYIRPVDIPSIPNVSDGSDIGAYELQTLASITISGTITHDGNGLANVTLTFSNDAGAATSDQHGNYEHRVDYGWSGSVTPSKQGYTFTPSTRNYTGVATTQIHQDYTALPSGGVTYILTVQSSPDTGVSISVSPTDKDNNGDGTTHFTRTYYKGTIVTLTAPALFNGKEFSKWVIDDNQSTSSSVQVTMDSSHTVIVHYVIPKPPVITLNRTNLHFGVKIPVEQGVQTGAQTLLISNSGGNILQWNAAPSGSWIQVNPSNGTGYGEVQVSVNAAGLSRGTYTGAITVSDPAAANSPQTVEVTLKVFQDTTPPFGSFDTPGEGIVLQGSIPVTGWALDDIGVANVKVYNGDTYIGDAVFVEGARSDIETTYPDYPNSYKAGWGYMLLTYSLPNGGNGNYTLTAKATDMEGNEVTLGSKTITIDNAHAVIPFGAIDTPIAGGTVSGKSFVNYGWALTPQPNTIPFDGSTINVVIDGVVKGHPVYNVFRSDIATLFPGYTNSNGAGGYYSIDTTKLKNGMHTIAWIVTDNAGNSDGIGSRYFSVMNTGAGEKGRAEARKSGRAEKDESRRGAPQCAPVFDGINIEIKELERVEINLSNEGVVEGYSVIGDQLKELPIGSTLDKERGVFYWQPGPGFLGTYRFMFIKTDREGNITRKELQVNIIPKF